MLKTYSLIIQKSYRKIWILIKIGMKGWLLKSNFFIFNIKIFYSAISLDSIVADPLTNLGMKSRINKCITGQYLNIEDNSIIKSSLLFENVKIRKE
jgi:HKD family nuclease